MFNRKQTVCVFMATYNGEKWVSEQINSILSQKDVRVHLLIHDDCSTDATPAICKKYAARHRNIHFTQNPINKGVSKNFMDMIYKTPPHKANYFALADQDDVWLPNKLNKAIAKLDHETQAALYYSDVFNVDENLQNESSTYRAFKPMQKSLEALLVSNWATGCTMVFNAEMLALLKRYEVAHLYRIHDEWIHLIALSCAKTYPDLNNSYIKRRIRKGNVIGEQKSAFYQMKRNFLCRPKTDETSSELAHKMTRTAQQLLDGYSSLMHKDVLKTVQDFANAPSHIKNRIKMLFDNSYRAPNLADSIPIKLSILLNKA